MRELTIDEMSAVAGGLRDMPENDHPASSMGDVSFGYGDASGATLTDDFGNLVAPDSLGNMVDSMGQTNPGSMETFNEAAGSGVQTANDYSSDAAGTGDVYVTADGVAHDVQTPTDPAFSGSHELGDVVTDAEGHTYVMELGTDQNTGAQNQPFWHDITSDVQAMYGMVSAVQNQVDVTNVNPTVYLSGGAFLGVGAQFTVSIDPNNPFNLENDHLYIAPGFGIGAGMEVGISSTNDLSGVTVAVQTPAGASGGLYVNDQGQVTGGTLGVGLGTPGFSVTRAIDVDTLQAPDGDYRDSDVYQRFQQLDQDLHPAY